MADGKNAGLDSDIARAVGAFIDMGGPKEGAGASPEPVERPVKSKSPAPKKTPADNPDGARASAVETLKHTETGRKVARIVYADEEAKSKAIHVLMQPTLYDALKEASEEDGVSVNEYISQAVREKILKSQEE